MKLQYVKLKNFKSYPDAETEFDLSFDGIKLVVGANGCLSGDSIIHFNRAERGFKTTIEKAYKSWNGTTFQGSKEGWNKNIPTFVRSYKKDKNEISLHQIDNIVFSGLKEVYLLTLENGNKIKATEDHQFLLETKEWKQLNELNINDSIVIDDLNKKNVRFSNKIKDKEIYSIKNHRYSKKTTWNSRKNKYVDYYRLPIHRLIYEANENNLSVDEYISILKKDKKKSDNLIMFDPQEFHIHHIDGNHFNNDIKNLKLISPQEHSVVHADYKSFNSFKVCYSKVKEIKKLGFEKTYDIICQDNYRNFSANGIIVHNSGKTTFFDAIIWCLYGKNQDGADGIVSRKTKKNCKVEVGFKIGGNNYSIVRYRKHETNGNKLLFFKGTKNISQRTAGATQELIDGIIEIQYNTMISSVILSSELYTSFLRASRSDRLKTLESILSLKEITSFYNKLKKMKDPIDEKVNLTEREKEKTEVEITSLSDNINEYKEGVKSTLLALKAEKENLQDEVFKLTGKVADYEKIDIDKELLNNETHDLVFMRNVDLTVEIENEEKRIIDINEKVDEYNSNNSSIDKWEEIDVSAEIVLLDLYEKELAHNEKINNGIDKLKIGINNNLPSLLKSIDLKKIEVKDLKKGILNLSENSEVCPTCGHDVDEELTKGLAKDKQDKIDELNYQINEENDKSVEIENKNNEIKQAISKLEDMLIDNPSPVGEYRREYLVDLKDKIRDTKTENLLLKKDIVSIEANNKEINKRLVKLKEELENNKKALTEPEHHTVFLKDLKEKVLLLKEEAEEKRLDIEKIDVKAKSSYDKGYIDNTLETIKKSKAKLKRIEKKLETAVLDQNHYTVLLTVFSNKDTGFKKFFINKMIGVFNDRINFYLPFFFDENVTVTFDKDLNETIKLDNEEVNFSSFSSGQKTRFDIAVSFSLFMMVKMFFSTVMNLLVFDEILDRNLDKKGFNSVYEIIENLGQQNTVFVVSHQEFYKEKFSHHINIKRNSKGFSYIAKEV